jgi:prevent-host-death family protein
MITVNMHEAKSRLSELVKAVETGGEIVILQRNGIPVAEIRALSSAAPLDRTRIAPDPTLQVELVHGYDPAEPLTEDEWPSELR